MMTSTMLWAGRALTGLFTLFMLGGSIAPKLLGARVATDAMAKLGWDPKYTFMIGMIELSSLFLHLFPKTTLLGSVLMTALLGGAVATQLRAGQPLFSHVLFGVYLGLAMWSGLWLRDPGFRGRFPVALG